MRRPLALLVAAALLAVPALARAEPLDLDLAMLGAPEARVWDALGTYQGSPLAPGEARQLANEAKARFAILSSETALALSSAILQPASTTGHSGFEFDMEAAYVQVHPDAVGSATSPFLAARDPWPTRGMNPHELFLPSFHVRKALPFSFELGGRMIYLSQSSMYAAQLEAKWALNEGFGYLPDVAVRGAWTQLFGQRDWNLGSGDVDLMVSKRWGVNGVTSFTPYLAARFTFVNASTDTMDFGPYRPPGPVALDERLTTQASFPTLHAGFYRTTVGLRFTAGAVSLAAEGTYRGGSTFSGEKVPGDREYPEFELASSWGSAFKLGFEW